MAATAERLCNRQAPRLLLGGCAREHGHEGGCEFPTRLGDGRTLFRLVDGQLECVGRAVAAGRAPATANLLDGKAA